MTKMSENTVIFYSKVTNNINKLWALPCPGVEVRRKMRVMECGDCHSVCFFWGFEKAMRGLRISIITRLLWTAAAAVRTM